MATTISGKRKHTKKLWFHSVDKLRMLFFIQLGLMFLVSLIQNEGAINCQQPWTAQSFSAYLPFFVLTGFLASYSLSAEKKQFGSFHILFYFIRRALDLLPYMFIAIASAMIYQIAFGLPCTEPTNLGGALLPMTSAWHAALHQLPVSLMLWSLVPMSILFLFYLLWPVLMWLIPIRSHLWLEIVLITLALLFRAGLFLGELPASWHPISAALPLMLGAILGQQVLLRPASFFRFRAYRRPIRYIAIPGGFVCLLLMLQLQDDSHLMVLLELLYCLSALLLVGLESTVYDEDGSERNFWNSGGWILPFTVAFTVGFDFAPQLNELFYLPMLQLAAGVFLGLLAILVVHRFTYSHFKGWKEKYTFRIQK